MRVRYNVIFVADCLKLHGPYHISHRKVVRPVCGLDLNFNIQADKALCLFQPTGMDCLGIIRHGKHCWHLSLSGITSRSDASALGVRSGCALRCFALHPVRSSQRIQLSPEAAECYPDCKGDLSLACPYPAGELHRESHAHAAHLDHGVQAER